MYTSIIDFCIYSVLPFKEEFKCHSCHAESAATCEKKEKVCKVKNPICMELMTLTGMGYVLQCADMDYYKASNQYCHRSNECMVAYCTESLCN